MDTSLIGDAKRRPDVWGALAELPFTGSTPVYEEIHKRRHALCRSFLPSKDDAIGFFYRGYRFRAVKCSDHIELLVNDPHCPPGILFEPLARPISP